LCTDEPNASSETADGLTLAGDAVFAPAAA
jgi:hypothetical protein